MNRIEASRIIDDRDLYCIDAENALDTATRSLLAWDKVLKDIEKIPPCLNQVTTLANVKNIINKHLSEVEE